MSFLYYIPTEFRLRNISRNPVGKPFLAEILEWKTRMTVYKFCFMIMIFNSNEMRSCRDGMITSEIRNTFSYPRSPKFVRCSHKRASIPAPELFSDRNVKLPLLPSQPVEYLHSIRRQYKMNTHWNSRWRAPDGLLLQPASLI